jgi:hypothetical protein
MHPDLLSEREHEVKPESTKLARFALPICLGTVGLIVLAAYITGGLHP